MYLSSASRSASNALLVPILRCENMSLQSRSEGRYSEQGAGVSVEASSIPSDPQRRKPDVQTCCDGVVEPSTGDGWQIKVKKIVKLLCSI